MTLYLRKPDGALREELILRWGLEEIATMAPGSHGDPEYAARREIKQYAQAILDAADRRSLA